MMRRFAVLVALLPLLVVPGAAPAQAAPPDEPTGNTITLVTGDRVTLTGDRVAITAARWPGRRADFRITRGPDGVRVLPSDVDTAVIDPRLFAVSALIDAGYDDARSTTLPVIVASGLATASLPAGRALPSINATAVRVPKDKAANLGASLAATPSRIWLDDRVRASSSRLDRNLVQVNAPSAWAAGLTGTGVRVAVLDTGVDPTHPDLAGRIGAVRDFTGGDDPVDRNGHGTHVASLVAGTGAAAGGARRGVAPGATLLAGKVLDDEGVGSFSSIIAGMEWAVASGARVVNMSLSSDGASTGRDPLSMAVDSLSASSGTLFVTSAGNRGPGATTIGAPGAADAALTVGAVDSRDRIAEFSSRGPRLGDHAIKPDIVAPGVDIVAARAAGTDLPGRLYTTLSGTSMAAPHVAGAAALLAERHPQWTGTALKAALVGSSTPVGPAFDAGAGRLDLARAVPLRVLAQPSSIGFGLVSYPQAGQPAMSRTVTLTNTGPATTVRLDTSMRAPDGMLTVSPSVVSLPAGGSATVTVTVAPALGRAGGVYSGAVTGPGFRIPVAVVNEGVRHVVRVRAVDRLGTSQHIETLATLINLGDVAASPDPVVLLGGEGTVRLVPGFYTVTSAIPTLEEGDGGGGDDRVFDLVVTSVSIATRAEVGVFADGEILLDARLAVPISAAIAGVDTTPVDVRMFVAAADRRRNSFVLGYDTSASDVIEGKLFVQPTSAVRHGQLELSTKWRLSTPDDTYDLLLTGASLPSDLAYVVDRRRLARVDTTYRAPGRPIGYREGRFAFTDLNPVSVAVQQQVPGLAPLTRREWLGGPADADWFQCVGVLVDDAGYGDYCQAPTPYRAGTTTARAWLRAPLRTTVGVWRTPLRLQIGLNDLADDEGTSGSIASYAFTSRSYTLSRNGVALVSGEDPIGVHRVPAGRATYTLRRVLTQELLPRSTRVESSWTFVSEPPRTGQPAAVMPIVDVAVHVPVDASNTVTAGRPLTFDVTAARGVTATLQLSTDDGLTWRSVPLRRSADGWRATTALAAGPVSLRVTGTDRAGNHTEQTIIRAFDAR